MRLSTTKAVLPAASRMMFIALCAAVAASAAESGTWKTTRFDSTSSQPAGSGRAWFPVGALLSGNGGAGHREPIQFPQIGVGRPGSFDPAGINSGSGDLWARNSVLPPPSPQAPAGSASQSGKDSSKGSSHDELVKQSLDPTASLMNFGFRDIVTVNHYGRSGSANQIQFQPAIPYAAWGKPNILRLTVPYNTGGVAGKGLAAVQIFNLTLFPLGGGRLGVGPVLNIVSNPALTDDRIQAGPAVGYVKPKGKWTLGLFNQNLLSADTQISAFQPIVGYNLGKGWALAAGDAQWTVDWPGGRMLNVPIGMQLSKVTAFGNQVVRLVLNPEYNAVSVMGTPHWTLRFGFQLLVPGK